MCRHLAYLGEPVTLAELLFDPEHSLKRQSWNPLDMRGGGTINVDGFGVGWYPGDGAPPVRYRRAVPVWGDMNFASLARSIRSEAVVGAVRAATPGMPVIETACAPFTEGQWLFSHNGVIRGWPDVVADIAGRLPALDLIAMEAPTDSALLWALVRDRLRSGVDPVKAVAATVTEVHEAAPTARLNLLLTDGERIVASTCGHSLWTARGRVASEPFGDQSVWEQADDQRIVVVTRDSTIVEAL
ncbi:ergothioneine biosynthesis protein EgtC [Longispora albida]|uniref:ergothioneine biosynthesis protein EgtC n=1 Tax=Longispora albida TaxID=203523 RepID=UPI00036099EF|nr:ergothioneine biosynthesis protein EgtC [Longispora albida]